MTQADIAEKLGISRTTVARALNGSGPVNRELKVKILGLAKESGYKVDFRAKTLRMSKEIYIQVFLAPFYNRYFLKEVCLGVQRASREFENSKLTVRIHISGSYSISEQEREIINIIKEEKPDGIVIIPLADDTMSNIRNVCREYNVKSVTLDMDSDILSPDFHVGPDYFKAGRLAGSLMKKLTKHKGRIILLSPHRYFKTLEKRKEGFTEVIENCSKMSMRNISIDIERDNIYETAMSFLKTLPGISGIYSTVNIEGLPEAIEASGKSGKVKLIGNDISPSVTDYVKNDVVDAVIYFRPYLQGYLAVKNLFEGLIMNTREYKNISTFYDILLDENIDDFKNPEGVKDNYLF